MSTKLLEAFHPEEYRDFVLYSNIPYELRARRQWVAATKEKVPINPRTGLPADPTNPNDCGTYEEALKARFQYNLPYIGFALFKSDPYCVIDLDDKADKPASEEQLNRFGEITGSIESYTEISSSGRGIHIVCRGSIPRGVKRDNVEIYSSGRYMIFTGDVLKQLPITNQQEIVSKMYGQMSGSASTKDDLPELEWLAPLITDFEVWEMATRAKNGEKFSDLWNGNWEKHKEYEVEGQSAADHALLGMLCLYSRSNEQVIRMFLQSGLGQRKKAKRDDYLIRSIRKIRAKMGIPHIDFSQLKSPVPEQSASECEDMVDPVPTNELAPSNSNWEMTFPPGLVGELAHYFYQSSLRPVPHVSLASAIALTAGIAARYYNISAQGLNHYIILVAKTGRGKEDSGKAIDRMLKAVRMTVPTADRFQGPGTFRSGQGLIKTLDNKTCFVSVLGEFGITLQQITRKDAAPHDVAFRKALLDLYSKSGFNDSLKPSAYSDSDKNTNEVQAPNVTILGEGSTETFYPNLDVSNIADGLIPRFTIINYDGPRVKRNPNPFQPPPDHLVEKVSMLCTIAQATEQNNTCSPVTCNGDALVILDNYDSLCDSRINGAENQAESELWNRAHLKVLKLAGLIAVGCDPHNPVITTEIAQWAVDFTNWEVGGMVDKFNRGEFGEGDQRQEQDLRRAIEDYPKMSASARQGYGVPKTLSQHGNVFPRNYLKRRVCGLSAFKRDRRGSNAALTALLRTLCEDGTLVRVSHDQAFSKFGSRAELYVIGENRW